MNFPAGTFAPAPGRAPARRRVLAVTALELRTQLRNGEQLLLALVIPLAVLLGMNELTVVTLAGRRIDAVTPGVLTLALMSTAFTAQAITTAFDRRYGVLKRYAGTGMSRSMLLASKTLSTLAVFLGQVIVLGAVALALRWHPHGDPAVAVVLFVAAAAAFLGLGLLLGGTLRAEGVLAVANLVWLVLVAVGGVLVPLTRAPEWFRAIGRLTPTGALSDGLRAVWTDGAGWPIGSLLVLLVWVLVGWFGTVRWFRWS